MQNTVVNFKTEEKVKKQIPKKTRSQKMKIFDVSAGKIIEVTPTQWFTDSLKESEEDIKEGRVITFNLLKEARDYLKKEIEDERKKQSAG